MLALFCLRLAAGMTGCLLPLPARLINPRFYRVQFLTVLGMACLGWLFLADIPASLSLVLNLLLIGSMVLAFAGSFVWSLEGAPAGKTLIVLTSLSLFAAQGIVETVSATTSPRMPNVQYPMAGAVEPSTLDIGHWSLVILAGFASSLVLGSAMTAMLMGHSYLVAPSMSLVPLLRLILLLGSALLLRGLIEAGRLLWWTSEHGWGMLGTETLLWLPVRWGIGLLLPLILAWMAWQTTRIRSTQSSTGILYVVVIFCFLGELTSLLLRDRGVTL